MTTISNIIKTTVFMIVYSILAGFCGILYFLTEGDNKLRAEIATEMYIEFALNAPRSILFHTDSFNNYIAAQLCSHGNAIERYNLRKEIKS